MGRKKQGLSPEEVKILKVLISLASVVIVFVVFCATYTGPEDKFKIKEINTTTHQLILESDKYRKYYAWTPDAYSYNKEGYKVNDEVSMVKRLDFFKYLSLLELTESFSKYHSYMYNDEDQLLKEEYYIERKEE